MEKQLYPNQRITPSILIVDDDPVCILLAEEILKKYFTVDAVTTGHAALEAIEKKKYEIVLMDINLNDETMDGIRTMRTIRHHRKHNRTKILAVTVSADTRERFIDIGFDGHQMKPLMEGSIIEELAKHLDWKAVGYI